MIKTLSLVVFLIQFLISIDHFMFNMYIYFDTILVHFIHLQKKKKNPEKHDLLSQINTF